MCVQTTLKKKHFNKKGNRLKRSAIPTLNLKAAPLAENLFKEYPQNLNQPTEPKERTHSKPKKRSGEVLTRKAKLTKLSHDKFSLTAREKKLMEQLRETKCTLASLRRSANILEKLESDILKEIVTSYIKNQKRKPKDYLKNFKQANTKLKSKRISVLPESLPPVPDETDKKSERKSSIRSSLSDIPVSSEPLPIITVTMVYDNYNTLTEILMTRMKDVPRSLLKIISLLLPFYQNLARITINKCVINMYTIYKLSKILETSTITEICLDDSSVAGADYTMLLETTKLRYLSLCRCNVEDNACKSIAAKLHYADSAQSLLLLNLSSNRITDEGAKHLSNALRSNRHLRYLNLADNHITDCGTGQILDVLIEFPLTCDEIMNMRRRRLQYLKRRNEIYAKYLVELCYRSINDAGLLRKKSQRRKTSVTTLKNKSSIKKEKDLTSLDDDYIKTKAEMLTTEALGRFEDPFHSKSIMHNKGYVYSIGNMTLAYLNLAYNNLSYLSIRKLQNVLKYQNDYKSRGGLVKVVLEGNNLPISCPELTAIDEMMARNRRMTIL